MENNEQVPSTQLLPTNKTPWLVIALAVLLFGTTVVFAYQNYQLKQQLNNQQLWPSAIENEPTTESFIYNNFSFIYPNDWILLDMSIDKAFPLRERLESLYGENKIVALSKNNLYMIIIIDKESVGSAGGIFIDDNDYAEFISNRDKFSIGNSTFYLSRNHTSTSLLIESHDGPAVWGALSEYIPNKKTESGNVFRGHEDIIKRGDYIYNFIITSKESGITDSQLQEEIINILKSIKW